MNSTTLARWLGASLTLILWEGCASREPRPESHPTVLVPPPPPFVAVPAPIPLHPPPPAAVPDPALTLRVSSAPDPGAINITSAVVEVMKLHTKHVSDEVVLTYIQGVTTPFTLGANEIVYLTDLGLPPALITAMVKRDTQLGVVTTSSSSAVRRNEDEVEPSAPAPIPGQEIAQALSEPTPMMLEAPEEVPPLPADETTAYYYYESLSPYGDWAYVDGYGWCWQPTAATTIAGWRPYVDNGCWLWCDDGWCWHSYYTWGWAPFHYGRWFRDPHRGWVWYPDREWAPAWVVWRQAGDYCGWAPLPPSARWHRGMGLTYWDRNFDPAFGWNLSWDSYHYIPMMHFCASDLTRYGVSPGLAQEIHAHAAIINVAANARAVVVNHGPGRELIGAVSHNQVRTIAVRETPTDRGRSFKSERLTKEGPSLVLYRPQLPNDLPTRPSALPVRPKAPLRPRAEATAARIPVPPRESQEFGHSVRLTVPTGSSAGERPIPPSASTPGAPLLPVRPSRVGGNLEVVSRPGSATPPMVPPSSVPGPATPPGVPARSPARETPAASTASAVAPPVPVPPHPTLTPPVSRPPGATPPPAAVGGARPTAPVQVRPSLPSPPVTETPRARTTPPPPGQPQPAPAFQPIMQAPTPPAVAAPMPAIRRPEPAVPVAGPNPVPSAPAPSVPNSPRPTYVAPPVHPVSPSVPSYTPPAFHHPAPAAPVPSYVSPPVSHPAAPGANPAPSSAPAAPHNSSENNKNKPGK